MIKTIKQIGIIAIAAIMLFAFTVCKESGDDNNDDNNGGNGGGTTTGDNNGGGGTTGPDPTYGISLLDGTTPLAGTHTFQSVTAGYDPVPGALTVTVKNTGNQATGNLTAALSGGGASNFTLTGASIASIAVDGTGTFTVQPNTGLAVNTYTATVTVSGGNSITAGFDVSFTVDPPVLDISETEYETIADIKTAFDELIADYESVKIIGTRDGAAQKLTLDIPEGKSVNWTATISGTADPLIELPATGKGTFNVTDGAITATTNRAIINGNTGEINISGGIVTSQHGNGNNGTIVLAQASTLNVTGGTVSHTGTSQVGAIRISNNGEVNISGGMISAEAGLAISVASANTTGAVINISGGTLTSANESGTQGTITLAASNTLNVTGGIIENTVSNNGDRNAIRVGAANVNVNISGGTVRAVSGIAIGVGSAGTNTTISISQAAGKTTLIESGNEANNQGTIAINASTILTISGGTVKNTSTHTNARAIQNPVGSTVDITGGEVRIAINNGNPRGDAQAIRNEQGVNISGTAEVDGFTNPFPLYADFTITFNQIADENALMPWDAEGGITITRPAGSPVTIALTSPSQYGGNIKWLLDGEEVAASDGSASYTLFPSVFNRTDVGTTHTLTVKVKLNGGSIWYSRAIEFEVEE